MLSEIADLVISGKLQDIFLQDEEYQKLSDEQLEASTKCYGQIPEEYHKLIEDLMDCQNSSSGRLIDIAYQQGMKDSAGLLKELGILDFKKI